MKTFLLFAAFLLFTVALNAQAPPAQAAGYNLVFSDTFSPLSLCTTNVSGCNWWYPGLYNFGATGTISNPTGYVNLNWQDSQTYTTDMSTYAMNGAYGKIWTFGYYEVSMAFDPDTGNWPAIFLEMANYNKNSVQTGPELDIFEWQSNTPTVGYSTLHTWLNGTDLENNSGSNTWSLNGATLSNYNTYGVLWTPTSIKFYFNNTLELTVSTTSGQYANYFAGQYPVFMAFQEASGCNFVLYQVTPCSGYHTPLNMQVQWAHVFQSPPISALSGGSMSGATIQ
jgi:beta-glucanase (GH16 family)